jgi:hypothetical protein
MVRTGKGMASTSTRRIRISRTAKGERPRNFSDPATEKVLGIVLSLASEVAVTRDRLDTLERLIETRGLLPRSAIEGYEPTPAEASERAARRMEYLERILQAVHRELDEAQTGRVARPLEEIIADFAAKRI